MQPDGISVEALVELLREGNKVLKGTGDRYLKSKRSCRSKPASSSAARRWSPAAIKIVKTLRSWEPRHHAG